MRSFRQRAAALVTAGTVALSAFVSGAGQAVAAEPPPSPQQIQQMIENKLGMDILWNAPRGNPARAMVLTGTNPQIQSFTITCIISYPPLRIRCTIDFSA
jgi:hypothetical protein